MSSQPQYQWPLPVRTQAHDAWYKALLLYQKEKRQRVMCVQLRLDVMETWKSVLSKDQPTTRAIVSKLNPDSLTMSPSLNMGHSGALSGSWRHLLMYLASIPSTRLLLQGQLKQTQLLKKSYFSVQENAITSNYICLFEYSWYRPLSFSIIYSLTEGDLKSYFSN